MIPGYNHRYITIYNCIHFYAIQDNLDCLQVYTESVASVSTIYFNCKKRK